MGPEDYEDSSLEQAVVEAPDEVSGTPLFSPEEDRRYADSVGARARWREHSPFRFNKQAFVLTAGAVAGVLLVVVAGTWLLERHSADPTNTQANNYASQSVATEAAKGYDQLLNGAASLQVNGHLQVSDGVTLQPSGAPTHPQKGQLYYDANTNQPYYYDGSRFVSFAPTSLPPLVSSLGGVNGDISLGSGLQVTSNGQLSLSGSVLQALSALSNGAVNWTNLTNYPGACASGQAITRLDDNPTCSTFLTSALADSSYLKLQGSTPGTAQSGNFNISGTGIASVLQAGIINATTGFEINGTAGANTSCAAGEYLDGAVTSGGIITGGSCVSSGNGGPAGGDLSGNYPNPTVSKIQGTVLNISGPTSGQILVWNGSGWTNTTVTGDVTITGTSTVISNNAVTSGKIADGTIAGVDVADDTLALGVKTTGNYQAFTTAGDGITVTGAAGEGTSPTIAVDSTVCRTSGNCGYNGAGSGSGVASVNTLSGDLTVQGSAGKVSVSDNGTNTITLDLDNNVSLLGQSIESSEITNGTITNADLQAGSFTNITGLGTIVVGTWNASSIADAYIDNNITIDASGSVNWLALNNYPAACGSGDAITALGDTLTCSPFLTGSAANGAYIQLQSLTPGSAQTGNLNITGTAIAGSFVGDGSGLTNINAANIATGTLDNARLNGVVSLLGQSIALGTETTGNYQTFTTAGDGISVTGVAGNGTTPTIAVDGTVCRTSGNCAGAGNGGGATNSGSQNYLTKTDASGNLISSQIFDDGTKIGVGTATPGYKLDVQGGTGVVAQFSGRVIGADAVNSDEFVTKSQLDAAAGGAAGSGVTSLNTLAGALTVQGAAGKVSITDNGTNTITLDLDASVSLLGQSIDSGEIVDGTVKNIDLQAGTFSNITGVGALVAGSINWSGAIATSGNISTSGAGTITSASTIQGTQLISTVAAGTAPLAITSTTVVANLNADLLDGQHGSYYQNAGNINTGTLADAQLSSNVALYNRATSNFTGTLQHNGNAVCDTSGNCAGAGNGGGVTSAGSQNYLAKTDAGGNLVNSQIFDNGTKVGIGTATPGYTLDVQGGTGVVAQFSGRVIGADAVNSNEFVTKSQLDTAAGGAAASGVTALNSLTGSLTVQGAAGKVTVTPSGGNTLTLDLDSSVSQLGQSIDSTEIVDGTIQNVDLQAGTFGNITGVGALVAGSISWSGNITTTGTVSGTTVNGTTINQNGNAVCDTSGNCGYTGVGTGAGVASLNTLSGDLVIQGNAQIAVSATTPNISLSIQADSIGDNQLTYNTGQNLTIASTPTFGGLVVNGNVGIGTGTPAYKLDVAGTANAITLYQNGNQVCDNSGNCAGNGNGGGATNSGQENFLTKTDSNGNLVSSQIFDDGTKISIGSTTPGYNLQVNGTVQATSLYQGANQVCDTSGNCGYNGAGSGAGVASVNTLTGDLNITGNSQILVNNVNSSTIGLSIQNDTIDDAQLKYDTGQNLTVSSTPTFAGLTLGVNGLNISNVAGPTNVTSVVSQTGGSLTAGGYLYTVTAIVPSGETAIDQTTVAQATISTSTGMVTVSWNAVPGATGYKLYRTADFANWYVNTLGNVTSAVDNGTSLTWTTSAIVPIFGHSGNITLQATSLINFDGSFGQNYIGFDGANLKVVSTTDIMLGAHSGLSVFDPTTDPFGDNPYFKADPFDATIQNSAAGFHVQSASGGDYFGVSTGGVNVGSASNSLSLNVYGTGWFTGQLITNSSVNSVLGYAYNGTAGSTTSCSGTDFLQNMVVQGGIITGGSCTAIGGIPPTLQNVYDNSLSPASILLTNAKDFVITAADTATDSNVLFNLQCTTSCGTNGRFAIQKAGSDVLTVNPNGNITIGTSTNGVSFASAGYEPILNGTAQHTKYVRVTAEYAGATLDYAADGVCNNGGSPITNGSMTSGYATSGTGGKPENYYDWNVVSGISTTQCYDVIVQVAVPSDWSSWTGTPTINAWGDSTSNASGAVDVIGGDGTQEGSLFGTSLTVASINSWNAYNLPTLTNSKYDTSTKNTLTLRIRMNAKSGANFRIGTINIPYKSKF